MVAKQPDLDQLGSDEYVELHGASCPINWFDTYELMDYVEERLNHGDHFNANARSMNITHGILSMRVITVGWGGVYHQHDNHDVNEAIVFVVPIARACCNAD